MCAHMSLRSRAPPTPSLAHLPAVTDARLWLLAVLTFGVGDLTTTALGLGVDGVAEASPVARRLIGHGGIAALAALKGLVVAVAFLASRLVPHPHRVGVPLGLIALGAPVTVWNLLVVVGAGA